MFRRRWRSRKTVPWRGWTTGARWRSRPIVWRSRPTPGAGWRGGVPAVKPKRIALIVFIIFFLSTLTSFVYLEKNIRPHLLQLGTVRMRQAATQAINKAITDRIAQGTNFDKLIEWKHDNSGKINGFMLNYVEHMKIASETVNVVQGTLERLSEIPEHIPLGVAMHSAILATFGPDIPVRLVPAGAVKVDLSTRQKNAGVNMILVEVYIRIQTEVSIIIPFETKPELVETEVPISYVLVVGDVPTYYFDSKGNPAGGGGAGGVAPPNVSIPGPVPGAGTAGESGKTETPPTAAP